MGMGMGVEGEGEGLQDGGDEWLVLLSCAGEKAWF